MIFLKYSVNLNLNNLFEIFKFIISIIYLIKKELKREKNNKFIFI